MTTRDEFRRLEGLFHELVGLPEAGRASRLEEVRAESAELAAELEGMLRRTGGREERALRNLVAGAPEAGEGDEVGPYRLLRRLGEGGMGVVFEGEQREPIRRRAAVKLIRPGLWSEALVARFERERRVLALMSHAGIAQVYEAGGGADGRPWVAMELVEGEPITEYCDRRRLPPRARVELFVSVLRAVQHAHQKGILHRDLKPSNLLVAERDGAPQPKIIDFGIAKSVDDATGEKGFTELGTVIGTLEYMSPEQASGQPLDTRSDLYGLGVVLYELLTGGLPIEAEAAPTDAAAADEVRRRIREEDPPRPSARLRRETEDTSRAAAARSSEPRALRRALAGDLDWITLRALAKEPDRRYDSATAFAADLEAYLEDRPVAAGPPGRGYRLRKFARRHRVAVAASALVVATLLVTAVTSTLLYLRAERERREAETQRRTAEEVSAFLERTLAGADPVASQDRAEIPVRALLDEASWRIGSDLEDQPRVAAALYRTIGDAYGNLGLAERARRSYEAAIEAAGSAGAGAEEVEARLRLADAERAAGDLEAARGSARAALEEARRLEPAAARWTGRAEHQLGLIDRDAGDYEGAEARLRDALAQAGAVRDHEAEARVLRDLGLLLSDRGRLEEAVAILEQGVAAQRAAVGAEHSESARALTDLAWAVNATRDNRRAIELLREALAILERVYPEDHPEIGVARAGLAGALREVGEVPEAVALLEESLAGFRRRLGDEHPYVAHTLNNLALALESANDVDRAVELYRRAVDHYVRLHGPDHPQVAIARYNLARVLRRSGELTASERECRESLRIRRAVLRDGHPDVARNLSLLAELRIDAGDGHGARELLREALTIRREGLPEGHPQIAGSLLALGSTEAALGSFAAAEESLLESHRLFVALAEGNPVVHGPNVERSRAALVELYTAWGKPERIAAVTAETTPP